MIMKMVTFNNDGGGFEEDEYITCKEIVDHDGVILTMMMMMMMTRMTMMVMMVMTMMTTMMMVMVMMKMMTIKNDGGGSAESNTRDLRRNPRPRWRDFIADLASFCPLPKATPGWARVPPFSNLNGNICYK